MTRELPNAARRSHKTVWVGGACLAMTLLACGPKPPPPHIVEVPIDQFDNGARPADGTPAETVAATTANEPATPGAARPSALAMAPQAPSGPPPGQRLTTAECDRMLDKGAIQYGVSKQMSLSKAMRSIPALRTQAQSDTIFAQVTSSCVQQNSKTQYNCAMKGQSFDKWKACFETSP